MSGFDFNLTEVLQADEYRISKVKPSNWAEERRIMSTEVSAFPGPFSYDRTPYLREVVDTLSPEHPARRVAVIKGAQIGFSTGVIENGIGWIISESPGPIFLLTASADLSKQSVDTKIDQMIQSCGLQDLIRPNVIRARNQRTGDTSTSKEFPGGRLQTGVTGQHNKLRQLSMQYGFVDDFEAAPPSSDKAGSTASLIEMRFASYYTKMKLYYISTPEVQQTSNIEPQYLLGDQRRWHVPCPCCGDFIVLEWSIRKDMQTFGITYKLDDESKLIPGSVGYTCQSCGGFFDDSQKYEMNLAGKWIPTAKPSDPAFYSYQISSLYAPPGMYDWEFYVGEYLKACPPGGSIKIPLYKTFVNTVLGQTWEERGETPNAGKLSRNTRAYDVGIIPTKMSEDDGNGPIVMLTCACDLNGIVEDARLDYEVVAWSRTGVSYSITHGSIGTFIPRENTLKKKVDREKWSYEFGVKNSVWPEFLKILQTPFEKDDETQMRILATGVDTGHYTSYAYEFMTKANDAGVFVTGLKGDSDLTGKFRLLEKDAPLFKNAREMANLYIVDTNLAKDQIAEFIKLSWNPREGVEQPYGFMNFPTPSKNLYTMQRYFSHYEAEHKILDTKKEDGSVKGFKWIKRNANVMNHLFDCRVYNMATRDILMTIVCKEAGIKYPNWQAYCQVVLGETL